MWEVHADLIIRGEAGNAQATGRGGLRASDAQLEMQPEPRADVFT